MQARQFRAVPKRMVVGVDFALRKNARSNRRLYPLIGFGKLRFRKIRRTDAPFMPPTLDFHLNAGQGRRKAKVHIHLAAAAYRHSIANANGAIYRGARIN